MTDLNQLVTNDAELPNETFDWGTLKWLYSDALSPSAEQTLGICHIANRRKMVIDHAGSGRASG